MRFRVAERARAHLILCEIRQCVLIIGELARDVREGLGTKDRRNIPNICACCRQIPKEKVITINRITDCDSEQKKKSIES